MLNKKSVVSIIKKSECLYWKRIRHNEGYYTDYIVNGHFIIELPSTIVNSDYLPALTARFERVPAAGECFQNTKKSYTNYECTLDIEGMIERMDFTAWCTDTRLTYATESCGRPIDLRILKSTDGYTQQYITINKSYFDMVESYTEIRSKDASSPVMFKDDYDKTIILPVKYDPAVSDNLRVL